MGESEARARLANCSDSGLQEPEARIELIPEGEWETPNATGAALTPGAAKRSGVLQRWAPILVKFASVQMIVQAIGFAAGILVVRNLPKQEYAFYTLCNTMLATILILADSGISSGMMAIGGRVWQDRARLSQLIRTALQLRRWLAAIVLPVVTTVLIFLLRHNGASVAKIAVLVLIVLLGCGLEFVTRIYSVALRLRSEVRQIQKQAFFGGAVRFSIIAVALMLLWFNVEIAVIAVAAAFAVQYYMLQRWSAQHLDSDAISDPEMRSEIVTVVWQQSPHTIYYCLQGQLMVWLISMFGSAERVADVGALSRLAVVFSILGSITNEVVFPAFSRIQDVAVLRRRYAQIVCGFTVFCSMLIAAVAMFPAQILSVLGGRYSHLHTEGILMAVSSILGVIAGVTWGLNSARAWVVPPMSYIVVNVIIQAVLIKVLDLSTVKGVLLFSILAGIPGIIWAMAFALIRIHQLQKTA